MRWIGLMLFSLLSLEAAQVQWYASYEQARPVAREKGMPMLLFMSKANCRAAEFMKQEVFSDDGVADYIAKHYVPVALNIVNADVPSHLASATSPLTHFVTADGRKVHRSIQGSKLPGVFIREMLKGVRGYKKIAAE